MKRRAIRADAPQRAIMAILRAAGCSVESLSAAGWGGIPDLLVGRGGVNYLVEVKTPGEGLQTVQREWHGKWRGAVMVWYGVADAEAWLQGRKPQS